jgi:hypothetical protein
MTTITNRKSRLAFVTSDEVRYRGRYRRVIVEVHRDGTTADVRLEGTRARFPFSFGGLYNHAVKLEVAKKKALKGKK